MNLVNPQYVTHSYSSSSLPLDGHSTKRLQNWQFMTNIGMLLGAGTLLAALSAPSILLAAGAGMGVVCISFLTKYGLSKVDETIACQIDGKKAFITTRLCAASEKGNRLMVKILLFFGANPNETHGDTHSPALHHAVKGCFFHLNQTSIMEDLLNAGADIKQSIAPSYLHVTPLNHALDIHHRESADRAAKLLLRWGANPNDRGRPYQFALFKAAINGKTEMLKELIEAGAGLENQEPSGQFAGETALFAAVRHAHVESVKLLLNLHANKDAKNKMGQTPIEVAKALLQGIASNQMGLGYDSGRGATFDRRPNNTIIDQLQEIINLL
jgi:hypothetical protein